jgi:xanthine dehydrogenase accessory factor
VAHSIFDALDTALTESRPVVLATAIAGSQLGAKVLLTVGESPDGGTDRLATGWTDAGLEATVGRDAEAALASGGSTVRHYGDGGRLGEDAHQVFFDAYVPPPRLIIFGAVDFTAALVRVAKTLGYHVVVCDARPAFATPARFPEADEIVVDWPHRHLDEAGSALGHRDAVCVLTHDAKFDVPAVIAALDTAVGYIGALGSRRTTDDRADRLRAEGVAEDDLSRIMAPIGLDLGARTPEETAIAICAEIIAAQTGRTVPRLRDTHGPIHARPLADTEEADH